MKQYTLFHYITSIIAAMCFIAILIPVFVGFVFWEDDELFKDLFKFYQVETLEELVKIQHHSILKLQEVLMLHKRTQPTLLGGARC
jgi:hypothetical protein